MDKVCSNFELIENNRLFMLDTLSIEYYEYHHLLVLLVKWVKVTIQNRGEIDGWEGGRSMEKAKNLRK